MRGVRMRMDNTESKSREGRNGTLEGSDKTKAGDRD